MLNRSQIMARIKSRGNASTELAFMRLLRRWRITGWRRHARIFGMRPDFVFRRRRVALFVDGCFWHMCADHCRYTRLNAHWQGKIAGNYARDVAQGVTLRANGWKVIRVPEHALKGKNNDGLMSIAKSIGR